MKHISIALVALFLVHSAPAAGQANAEQEVLNLSKTKWRWMAERNVDSLAVLFDSQAVFVHMGGSWGTDRELEVIKSGGIHYKHAEISRNLGAVHRDDSHCAEQDSPGCRGRRQ
jgi:hypothetical protein